MDGGKCHPNESMRWSNLRGSLSTRFAGSKFKMRLMWATLGYLEEPRRIASIVRKSLDTRNESGSLAEMETSRDPAGETGNVRRVSVVGSHFSGRALELWPL